MTAVSKITPAAEIDRRTPRRGFRLPCLRCGAAGGIRIYLDALADGRQGDKSVHCCICDETYDVADVRAVIDGWSAALAWFDTAPLLPPEE